MTKKYLKHLVYQVNGSAIEVHKILGPGLLESVYHKCLEAEFKTRKIDFESELSIPLKYKNSDIHTELRCDFLVEKRLVVELKAVEHILPIHEAQLLTYMKLLQVPKGLLINFNTTNIYLKGQKTYVNELYKNLKD